MASIEIFFKLLNETRGEFFITHMHGGGGNNRKSAISRYLLR